LTIRPRRKPLLGDRYELQSVIATGGMGRVWRARDTVLDRTVAVKVLAGALIDDPSFVTRFRYEARHAALVADPHVAAVHDYGEGIDEDGEQVAYLVMELVEGETLASLMRRDGGLEPAEVLDVVRQTAVALAAAHAAGVVHRDVKPANVLVRPDGVVKLTDFGVAWSAANVPLTRAGQVLGSVHYLAPERVEGARATAASDVYSLGVIAYECLAGARPFEGDNVAATALRHVHEVPPPLPDHLPAAVRDLVERAMARQAADRIPDGAALRDAVDAVLADGAVAPDRHPTVVLAPENIAPQEISQEDVAQEAGGLKGGLVRMRTAVVSAVALLLLVLVVGAALALSPDDSGTPAAVTRSAPPSQTSAPAAGATPAVRTTATLTAEDVVGRPVDEVQAELIAAGFSVQLRPTAAPGVPAGQVVAIDPVGEVVAGQLLTVTFAEASAAPAPTTAPAATEAPAAPTGSTADEATTSRSAGPGRGHGHRHKDG
jgi:serine/threonine-protein kinase